MLDSVFFDNADSETAGVEFNSVTNGAGISIKEWNTSVDTREEEKPRSMMDGLYPTNFLYGKRLFQFEGDLMDTSPTAYWTRRQNFFRELTHDPIQVLDWSGSPSKRFLGYLNLTLTGLPEVIYSEVTLDGYPDMPIGLAGSTISPYRIAFKAVDPAIYGQTLRSQDFLANAAAAALTALAGNAPTWPTIVLTGPFSSGAQIQYRGGTIANINIALSAGNTITIIPKDRTIYGSLGLDYYDDFAPPNTPSSWNLFALDPRETSKTMRLVATGTTGATKMNVSYRNAYYL